MAQHNGGLQHSRAYQLEMFEKSMKRNVIVCMAAGSGKTNVAKLRIEAELQRTPAKRVWFTAPNVVLAQQQHYVLSSQLPHYQMRTLLGHDHVHLWHSPVVWRLALANMQVIISTPQVLLDALRNAFVRMEDISLLVVDEAHHCHSGSPSAKIMLQHYHLLKSCQPQSLPHILGLTASIRISEKSPSVTELEHNLDAVCQAPTLSIDDYAVYVHRAQVVERQFTPTEHPRSKLFNALQDAVAVTTVNDDPYNNLLQNSTDPMSEQKLRKYDKGKPTPAMRELKQLLGNAEDLHQNIGAWASDTFIRSCVFNWHNAVTKKGIFDESVLKASPRFVDCRLSRVREAAQAAVPSVTRCLSDKSQQLIKFLASAYHSGIAIIIFVERRSTAFALCELLRSEPILQSYRIFPFVGLTASKVGSLVEVADMQVQKRAFADFRKGSQDICIATSVAEEGVDIQAVNFVIRYDDPKQFVSFLQSRGRARQKDSKFLYFRNAFDDKQKYAKWHRFEEQLETEYRHESRLLHLRQAGDELDEGHEEEYIVRSTGAKLVYDNAVQHLQHFCSIVSKGTDPVYILVGEVMAPIEARVILPACVPFELRETTSKRAWLRERAAKKDAAFQAYKALHEAGLVTDNLVPFQPEPVHNNPSKHGLRTYELEGEFPVWHVSDNGDLFSFSITITHNDEPYAATTLVLPCSLEHTLHFQLSEGHPKMLDVEITPMGKFMQQDLGNARQVTRAVFELVFQKGSATTSLDDASRIEVLVVPESGQSYDTEIELTSLRHLVRENSFSVGQLLLVWHGRRPGPYVWRPQHFRDCLTADTLSISVTKVRKLQLYTSMRNACGNEIAPQSKSFDIDECSVERTGTAHATLFIPSILHVMTAALRAQHAREHVFKDIGLSSIKHLVPALLAKSASGVFNYERLEFLGDAYLKYRASLQMYFDHPLAMEGMLTGMVRDLVSNLRLEKAFQDAKLAPYITTQAAVQKHWKIPQLARHKVPAEKRVVVSKTLGDVVESVLAAAFLDGSSDEDAHHRCTTTLQLFLPNVDWKEPAAIVSITTSAMTASKAGSSLLTPIEAMIGYTCLRSILLLEALTHSSAQSGSSSLERLEFLGDAIVDLILKLKFFHCSELGPDRMTSHRAALASHAYLAFCAFGLTHVRSKSIITNCQAELVSHQEEKEFVHIESLIQLGSSRLRDPISAARERYVASKAAIESQLAKGMFPWTLLRSINAPKLCSDVVESLIAAIYLDSGGSLDECEKVLERLGVMDLLHMMINNQTFESDTPATRLRHFCAKHHIAVQICSADTHDDSKHIWKVVLTKNGHLKEYLGREVGCEDEARSIAAEVALESMLTENHEKIFQKVDATASQDSMMTDIPESGTDTEMSDGGSECGGGTLRPESDSD